MSRLRLRFPRCPTRRSASSTAAQAFAMDGTVSTADPAHRRRPLARPRTARPRTAWPRTARWLPVRRRSTWPHPSASKTDRILRRCSRRRRARARRATRLAIARCCRRRSGAASGPFPPRPSRWRTVSLPNPRRRGSSCRPKARTGSRCVRPETPRPRAPGRSRCRRRRFRTDRRPLGVRRRSSGRPATTAATRSSSRPPR